MNEKSAKRATSPMTRPIVLPSQCCALPFGSLPFSLAGAEDDCFAFPPSLDEDDEDDETDESGLFPVCVRDELPLDEDDDNLESEPFPEFFKVWWCDEATGSCEN